MAQNGVTTISRQELARRLEHAAPYNEGRTAGFALVSVAGAGQFDHLRIPGSANIPQGQEQVFEQRFDKRKEIIVYSISARCDASEKAARELARRGFERVLHYRAGVSDWRAAGRPIAGSARS